jgi:D-alanyl-D-alanine carboxypeptidase/D-alanyl-D-alanine-endopeptidase (penicillin-binding protein 4)
VVFDALPILGVDGSLVLVQQDSPAAGQVRAKTGTGISVDLAHGRPFLTTKALAGYIDTSGGRRLAFSLYVNNGLLDEFDDPILGDVFQVNDDLGKISATLWSRF